MVVSEADGEGFGWKDGLKIDTCQDLNFFMFGQRENRKLATELMYGGVLRTLGQEGVVGPDKAYGFECRDFSVGKIDVRSQIFPASRFNSKRSVTVQLTDQLLVDPISHAGFETGYL